MHWIKAAAFILPVLLMIGPQAWAAPTNSTETSQVQSDVTAALRGVYGNDPETVIGHTHETIIRLMGGREKALSVTRQSLAQVAAAGISIESLKFPAEPVFLRTSTTEYVLVPTKMILRSGGKRAESLNYQFGARRIGETQWKYVEGSRINQTNVATYFPDFPHDHKFPPTYRKIMEQ
jgi:hypothetical protein